MTRATIRIVQLLCPQRHCVIAMAYLSENGAPDPSATEAVKERFDSAVQCRMLNPWCDICKSRDLHTEDGATRFSTLEEARPFLEDSERAQHATAIYLRSKKN